MEKVLESVDSAKDEWFSTQISVDGKGEGPVFFDSDNYATGTVKIRDIGWWTRTFTGMSLLEPRNRNEFGMDDESE